MKNYFWGLSTSIQCGNQKYTVHMIKNPWQSQIGLKICNLMVEKKSHYLKNKSKNKYLIFNLFRQIEKRKYEQSQ